MALNKSTSFKNIWSPFKLWALCLALLASGLLFHFFNLGKEMSSYLVLASFLLWATGNPILNVVSESLRKNLAYSFPIFIAHAVLVYMSMELIQPEFHTNMKKIFSSIVVFYLMITTLSIFFRAIYKYMEEN